MPASKTRKPKTEAELGYTRRFNSGGRFASGLRKFGITPEDYDFMYAYQSGCCGICKTHSSQLKKRLCVDHCHNTGTIRGLLCSNCNTAIGLLKENKDSMRRAARWVMTEEELLGERLV